MLTASTINGVKVTRLTTLKSSKYPWHEENKLELSVKTTYTPTYASVCQKAHNHRLWTDLHEKYAEHIRTCCWSCVQSFNETHQTLWKQFTLRQRPISQPYDDSTTQTIKLNWQCIILFQTGNLCRFKWKTVVTALWLYLFLTCLLDCSQHGVFSKKSPHRLGTYKIHTPFMQPLKYKVTNLRHLN